MINEFYDRQNSNRVINILKKITYYKGKEYERKINR